MRVRLLATISARPQPHREGPDFIGAQHSELYSRAHRAQLPTEFRANLVFPHVASLGPVPEERSAKKWAVRNTNQGDRLPPTANLSEFGCFQ